MFDPPGQRLKLPDGPSVQLRRGSEHCLRNRELLERISKIVNATEIEALIFHRRAIQALWSRNHETDSYVEPGGQQLQL